MEATDLVVVIGATNDPAACSKKDEAPFIKFWERTIHCPLPYYGADGRLHAWCPVFQSALNVAVRSDWGYRAELTAEYAGGPPLAGDRLVLWPSLSARFGGTFGPTVSVSTLAHISDSQSTANIAQILRRIFTPRRIEVSDRRPVTMDELMARLSQFKTTPPDVFATLQTWEKSLPGFRCVSRAALLRAVCVVTCTSVALTAGDVLSDLTRRFSWWRLMTGRSLEAGKPVGATGEGRRRKKKRAARRRRSSKRFTSVGDGGRARVRRPLPSWPALFVSVVVVSAVVARQTCCQTSADERAPTTRQQPRPPALLRRRRRRWMGGTAVAGCCA